MGEVYIGFVVEVCESRNMDLCEDPKNLDGKNLGTSTQ